MTIPYFTIVMPTRNRASYLPFAMQSALQQTFGDYELIISDNCSADDTAEIAQSFSDPRIRYIRTPASLSMPDSWEFGLSEAQGEFVVFLSDDDAFTPRLLETVHGLLADTHQPVVSWALADYYYADWFVPGSANILRIRPFTGSQRIVDSSEVIHDFFGTLRYDGPSPRMVQSACSRELVVKIQGTMGRFFHGPGLDVSAAVKIACMVDHYVYLDRPLLAYGYSRASNRPEGLAQGNSPWEEHFREIDDKVDRPIPLSAPVMARSWGETLLCVKAAVGDRLTGVELDWNAFCSKYSAEVAALEREGQDVRWYQEELRHFVTENAPEMQETEGRKGKPGLTRYAGVRAAVRRQINRVNMARRLEVMVRPVNALQPVRVSGAEAGFANIVECSRVLESLADRGFRAIAQQWMPDNESAHA